MQRLASLALVISAVLAAACSNSSVAPAPRFVGHYELATVDGGRLPYSIGSTEKTGPWFVRGALEIREDGSYVQTLTDSLLGFQPPVGTATEPGAWLTISRDSITLAPANGAAGPARLSGDTLTRREFGRIFQFVHRSSQRDRSNFST